MRVLNGPEESGSSLILLDRTRQLLGARHCWALAVGPVLMFKYLMLAKRNSLSAHCL
jgi:hypothetical protein